MQATRTLATERVLDASPERVWRAFSDAGQLAQWWGPDGFTNEFDRFDFHAGGDWLFTMVGPDGQRYANQSRFTALTPMQRLVIDHVSPPRFTLTVTFALAGAGTHLTWSQCFETPELAEALAPICVPANEQNLDRLARVLAAAAP
jgi:uncharacterized protein YndB with AHSA1/START domain